MSSLRAALTASYARNMTNPEIETQAIISEKTDKVIALEEQIKAAQEKQASSLINFSEIKELKFFLPGKTFFSFLKPEHKRTIEASFTGEAGRKLYFTIVTHSDAFLIYKKLTQIQA